ncbi:membrane protein YcaP [Escherichia coli]|uniref:Membrane protein YcaP n=1 Tax=Escherichia coli TaxID=562 RepID=A0A376P3K3_ECOLX|nr:membrane protein YcaP [Escherichia coli]
MKAFDLHRMAFDKVPFDFLGEVALRSLYTFVLVFLFLKMTGRRGVRQMSLFEVLIILTLGSAAGDVAFYDDVPMVPVLIVFITLALLYRLVMWLMAHSENWKIYWKVSRLLLLKMASWPGRNSITPT